MKPKINWKEIKPVLLDMDGTLLDLYFDYYFWQEYLPEIWGKKNNMKTNTAKVKLLDWYQQESGTLSWYCIDFWTRKLNFDVLALKADVRHLIKYRPHAESFLQQLNDLDFSLTMVTNAHEKLIKMKSDETGIDTFFNQIISSHSIGHAKEEYAFWEKLKLKIPFNVGDKKIEVIGTWAVPEFGAIAGLVLAVAIISIIVLSTKTKLNVIPKF